MPNRNPFVSGYSLRWLDGSMAEHHLTDPRSARARPSAPPTRGRRGADGHGQARYAGSLATRGLRITPTPLGRPTRLGARLHGGSRVGGQRRLQGVGTSGSTWQTFAAARIHPITLVGGSVIASTRRGPSASRAQRDSGRGAGNSKPSRARSMPSLSLLQKMLRCRIRPQ